MMIRLVFITFFALSNLASCSYEKDTRLTHEGGKVKQCIQIYKLNNVVKDLKKKTIVNNVDIEYETINIQYKKNKKLTSLELEQLVLFNNEFIKSSKCDVSSEDIPNIILTYLLNNKHTQKNKMILDLVKGKMLYRPYWDIDDSGKSVSINLIPAIMYSQNLDSHLSHAEMERISDMIIIPEALDYLGTNYQILYETGDGKKMISLSDVLEVLSSSPKLKEVVEQKIKYWLNVIRSNK